MRSTLFAVLAAAGIGLAGTPAMAAPVNGAAINDAAAALQLTEQVHCVPGWSHHRPTSWRFSNGCARVAGPAIVVTPGFHHHRFHHHHRRHHHHHHHRRHRH
jgi:hypothetical protein